MASSMRQRAFLGLDIVKIRHKLQVFAQGARAEGLLESRPEMGLQIIVLAQPFKAILKNLIQFGV